MPPHLQLFFPVNFKKRGSPLNVEPPEFSCCCARCNRDLFDSDERSRRGPGQPDKVREGGRGTLGNHHHGPVRHIFHPPVNPGRVGATLNEMPVPNPLDFTSCYRRYPLHNRDRGVTGLNLTKCKPEKPVLFQVESILPLISRNIQPFRYSCTSTLTFTSIPHFPWQCPGPCSRIDSCRHV